MIFMIICVVETQDKDVLGTRPPATAAPPASYPDLLSPHPLTTRPLISTPPNPSLRQ